MGVCEAKVKIFSFGPNLLDTSQFAASIALLSLFLNNNII